MESKKKEPEMNELEAFLKYLYEEAMVDIDILDAIHEAIENNNSEMKQRTFVFSLIPSYVNDRLNIVWNGNYGLEFRINNINLVDIVGYMGLDTEFTSVAIEDKIPNEPKYAELVEFLKDNPRLDDFGKARKFIEQRWFEVRNNRDFEYYNRLIDLIDDLKQALA
jgi:hypothetical protein